MSSTSDFTLPEDLSFQEVFHALKKKFGFPLPPEEISISALGKEKFDFFAQSKFLLTYSRRNFTAAVREFEAFANLDNLAEETLSRASDIESTERRQAAIQKRRIRAFNQELEKQLRLFNRDGGSIVTQGNQRNSTLSAGRQTTTERSDSIIKTSDKTRKRVLEWRQSTMAARSGQSRNLASRSGLRTRESFDNEINDAFPYFYEEPTEIDIETDESGMIPASSFRAETLAGAIPEVGFQAVPMGDYTENHERSRTVAPSSSKPLQPSVHSPPAKPVKSQNWNWGTYEPPADTLTSRPTLTQVPKPSIPALNSNPKPKPKPNSFAPSVSSDTSARHLHTEDTKKRKQSHCLREVMDRPSKRQSPVPQDRQEFMSVQPPKPVSGGSFSRAPINQSSWTENQAPSFQASKIRNSFETDITEESISDSMLRSRNDFQGTQPTSFNSTMEGKIATSGRYDDISEDLIPPLHGSRNGGRIGSVYASRTASSSSVSSTNGSRPVMRGGNSGGNRPVSPSTQLQFEQEQASSSRDCYSVGESTLDEMWTMGLPQSRRQKPPSGKSTSVAPAQSCSSSEVAVNTPQPRNGLSHSVSTKTCRFQFYQTLTGENFPGDIYMELFKKSNSPFWLQWEVERMILATTARNAEADKVPKLLKELLKQFLKEPDMGYEAVQDKFKEFWTQFKQEEKYDIPNLKRDSYAAILRSENGWDNRIQLSAELSFERFPGTNGAKSLQVFKPTLRPRALNLRSTTTRFDRKFGSDRFMSLRVPKIDSASKNIDLDTHHNALARYLSHEGFEFLGRRWRAICHRSSTKDENGKRISLAKQDKTLQVIVIMFAVSGPGLETVDQRSAVEWLVPIEKNMDSKQCKLYARIALGFSTTTPSVVFDKNEIDYSIKDIKAKGLELGRDGKLPEYSLTDGCGLASPAVFRAVARQLGLPYPPSAVQARIGAAKGLWIMDPSIPLDSEELRIRIRPDQNKFDGISLEPEHRTLDICNTSKPLKPSALNLQFIVILLHNGVTEATLEQLLREDIRNEVTELFNGGRLDDGAFLRKYLERVKLSGSQRDGRAIAMKGRIPLGLAERAIDLINAGFTLQNQTLKDWFEKVLTDHCDTLKDKMRIRIPWSCQPYCVPDPSGKLKKGQVYLRFGPESKFIDPKTMMAIDVLRGGVLVGRNPAHFASDIQKVTAVDVPELRFLTDVIVFPADPESNDRSLADYLSGGDYDGDRVWTCWDQRLVGEFKGELVHGPSTVDMVGYFEPERKMMWEDFGGSDESPDAFSNFIQKHLETAMDEELLGQCTSLFEKVVYNNYGDERGVLNLEIAKKLGVACGMLVDAPKQGIRLKLAYWKIWKNTYKDTQLPFYKLSEKDLVTRKLFKSAKKSRHPIDRLKFQIAADEVSSLIAQFKESCKGTSYKDEDLLIYTRQFFARCATDMESREPFNKEMAMALLVQRNHLNRELDVLLEKWRRYWAGRDFDKEDEKDSEISRNLVEECVRIFDNILPYQDNSTTTGKALVAQWKLSERDPFSEWNRVKASLLHEKTSKWNDSKSSIPWFVAGDIMCFEKWRTVSQELGRRSGFVTQPISNLSRIKASALKKATEDRDWLSGGPVDEDGDNDDSDVDFDDE
ncbi:hypothetical protein AOL_s00054g240 [Orbilia oligospora ATCC 24927]|uniref:RDRP core domain-containing protein n=1 Tax=Arthrobotrys oligospora (strain ATCC 24927 / CBS 115.81 / DSM 1491) TaxID=756982 RepID=G1X5U6_ARTOA|nr:hypothetical protein AOL_s00054g240 [Orbilia oligospora ATCC 24927]EGX51541.1 hypothetical protein AOL_s00054g240 [Orbilia oligospora ATCC 24927]